MTSWIDYEANSELVGTPIDSPFVNETGDTMTGPLGILIDGGSHDGHWLDGDAAGAKTPDAFNIAVGSAAAPSTSANPVITIGTVTTEDIIPGLGRVYLYSRNGNNTPWFTLKAESRDFDPDPLDPTVGGIVVGSGLGAVYASIVANTLPKTTVDKTTGIADQANPSNGVSDFAIWTSVQRFVPRHDVSGCEFTMTNLYVRTVTGAANNGAGLIRLTMSSNHYLTAGDSVLVKAVGGVPNASGIWVVGTVTDPKKIDLVGSTFAGAYTGGGTVALVSAADYAIARGTRSIGCAVTGGGFAPHTVGYYLAGDPDAKFYVGYDISPVAITLASDYVNQTTGVGFRCQAAVPSLQTANNQPIVWRNAAGTANIEVLKLNASDDTILNMRPSGALGIDAGGAQVAIFDSAGSLGVGVTSGLPSARLDVKGDVAMRRVTVAIANGANNDIAATGAAFLKLTGPTGAYSVSGFTGGVDGRHLWVYFAGGDGSTLTIISDAGSAPANRIVTLSLANVVYTAGPCAAHFIYDAGLLRWVLMSVDGYS